jgi:hypothetical protein
MSLTIDNDDSETVTCEYHDSLVFYAENCLPIKFIEPITLKTNLYIILTIMFEEMEANYEFNDKLFELIDRINKNYANNFYDVICCLIYIKDIIVTISKESDESLYNDNKIFINQIIFVLNIANCINFNNKIKNICEIFDENYTTYKTETTFTIDEINTMETTNENIRHLILSLITNFHKFDINYKNVMIKNLNSLHTIIINNSNIFSRESYLDLLKNIGCLYNVINNVKLIGFDWI